jgi:hypothetical protein
LRSRANACVCEILGGRTPRREMHHAKVVFVGELLEIREDVPSKTESHQLQDALRFRVERYWKGGKAGEEIGYGSRPDCDHHFEVGAKYLVYGEGKQRSTACTGTRKVEDAEKDLRELGSGRTLKAAEPKR